MLFSSLAQFIDHDVDLTEFSSAFGSMEISIEDDNDLFIVNGCLGIHFERSEHHGGGSSPREQLNLITSFVGEFPTSNGIAVQSSIGDSLSPSNLRWLCRLRI